MYTGQIDVYSPFFPQIRERTIEETLNSTHLYWGPFVQLLSARWIAAAEGDFCNNSRLISSYDEIGSDIVLLHDFFHGDLLRPEGAEEFISRFRGRIFIVRDLPNYDNPPPYKSLAKNAYDIDRHARWHPSKPYRYRYFKAQSDQYLPVEPMGCGQGWLPNVDHKNRVIILDEPHITVLEVFDDENDIRTRLYGHALDVTKILADRGFEIKSFCRLKNETFDKIISDHDYIEPKQVGSWIPFTDVVRFYSQGSLFYSFTAETFGYSCYENLQLGNGVICYNETHDPYTFRQMQNSVLLSIYMRPETAADLICEYFDRLVRYSLRDIIREDAFSFCSADTYISRVRGVLDLGS